MLSKIISRPSFFLSATLPLLLASCGPIYSTDYVFSPPKTDGGKGCTYQCETTKLQCHQLEELKAERCEDRAEREKYRCENEIYRKHNRDPKWYECGLESCTADTERCEDSYRNCYRSCGGRVEKVTTCVSGCDQVPANKRKDSGE